MSHRPIQVFLADLTHVNADGKVATEAFPLNIGLVASYARKHLGPNVEFRLFKYPDVLIRALKEEPPDILGASNYTWNSNLTEHVFGIAKALKRDLLTILGGTNYPFEAEGQREFLLKRPHTDFHVFYEGETAFLGFLKRFLSVHSVHDMKDQPLDGIQFLDPDTRSLISGASLARIKTLDEIPSPYTTGLLDEFFDGRLSPLMETARGCPFTCNYCNAGDQYFTKVNMFSLDYFREELFYIAPRIAKVGVTNMTLADNNFGMFPRDEALARLFHEAQERFGWPRQLLAWSGKNSKERVIKATEILGSSLSINMAVQSMDPGVLKNIKRSNISLDAYTGITKELTRQGRSMESEIIVPLPGETLTTYREGVSKLMDSGSNKITSYTLQLLYGTPYKDPTYRKEHGYVGRWRIVPLDFGEYEGERIFDLEEVAVSSRTMSFDDYLQIRMLALVTELTHNNYIFFELTKFLRTNGVRLFDWVDHVWRRLSEAPAGIQDIVRSFVKETKEELWDSEEDLVAHYRQPEHYEKLVKGEAGGNVLYKHKAMILSSMPNDWLAFIVEKALDIMRARGASPTSELAVLQTHCQAKIAGVLQKDADTRDIVQDCPFDILRWLMESDDQKPLSNFHMPVPREMRYFFSEAQLREREDHFARYGSSATGLAKIMQRNPTFNRLFRQVAYADVPRVSSVGGTY